MDELRMFLENEGWELCPVKSSFSIMQLQVRTVRISLKGHYMKKQQNLYSCILSMLLSDYFICNIVWTEI